MMKTNEDRNVIGVFQGHLESERKCVGGFGGHLEFRVLVSVVSEYQRMVRMELEER